MGKEIGLKLEDAVVVAPEVQRRQVAVLVDQQAQRADEPVAEGVAALRAQDGAVLGLPAEDDRQQGRAQPRVHPVCRVAEGVLHGVLSQEGGEAQDRGLVVEAVRQVRGECGERQVKDAETAFATGFGGVVNEYPPTFSCSTLILRR